MSGLERSAASALVIDESLFFPDGAIKTCDVISAAMAFIWATFG